MSNLMQDYRGRIDEILAAIMENETENIDRAAEILAKAVIDDRLIHILGAGGHSSMAAMEVFYRAGGLVQVNAMFPPGMSVLDSHPTMARLPGTGPFVLNFYRVRADDPLIVVNFYGITAAGIEAALAGKERGVKLITVNSHEFSSQVPDDFKWRHPAGKNLHELADVAIDNHVPYLDAVLEVPGVDVRLAATGTIATAFTMNCLMARAAEEIAKTGRKPDVWLSNNVPGGDEFNRKFVDRYMDRVHHMYPTW